MVDQLSFLDLLYAVPVGDLAMRISSAELARISSADWSALAVIVATIVLSWIGLHKNRAQAATAPGGKHPRSPIGLMPLWSLRFVQFLIEIIIIGTYFAMGLFLKLPTESDSAIGLPAEDWLTGILLVIFVLYLAWDWTDARLARSTQWHETARAGEIVTMKSLVPVGVIFLVALLTRPPTAASVIALNTLLVIFLYSYRFAQDRWGNTRQEKWDFQASSNLELRMRYRGCGYPVPLPRACTARQGQMSTSAQGYISASFPLVVG